MSQQKSESTQVVGTELYAWGFSRLDVPDKSVPTPVLPLMGKSLVDIAAGDRHSLALGETGEVYVWGDGQHSQLGLENGPKHVPRPTRISALETQKVVAVAAGATHSMALCGRVNWSPETHQQCPKYFQKLVGEVLTANYFAPDDSTEPGCRHMSDDLIREILSFLLAGNEIFTWGDNEYGQLGIGNTITQPLPTWVSSLQGTAITQIAAGGQHCVIVAGNGLYSWGRNSYGQLGHGTRTDESTPKMVEKLKGKRIDAVSAGAWHTMALCGEEVWTWGCGRDGRLGHADKQDRAGPTLVATLRDSIPNQIACGGAHSLCLSEGVVMSWGNGENGKLGLGNRATSKSVPTDVATIMNAGKNVRLIATGGAHSLAVCDEGCVYAWGEGENGQLGLMGDYNNYFIPREVPDLQDKNIVALALGHYHCLALVDPKPVEN